MKLFRLEPIGIGTPEVEALSSYVHRLSLLHGVSVGQLLQRVEQLSGRNNAPYRKNPFLSRFIRPNETTRALVEDLEIVSDQRGLAALTLVPLIPCVSRDLSSYARDIRWCASCLEEKKGIAGAGYYKLVWQFRAMKHCPIHGDSISRLCGHCGNNQNTFKQRVDAENCQHCHRSLSSGNLPHSKIPRSWKNDAADLCELVERLPGYINEPPQVDAPRKFLESVIDYYESVDKEVELYKKVDCREISVIAYAKFPVTLRVIRKYAFQLNVSIDRVLAGASAPFEPPLDLDDSYRPSQLQRFAREKRNHHRIFKRIKSTISENGPELSLRQLASQSGVSVGYIEYRLPDVKHKVVKTREGFLASEKSRKWRESLAAAHEYFTRDEELFVMSRKQALKVLMAETGLPKHVLRKAIRIAFEQQPEEL